MLAVLYFGATMLTFVFAPLWMTPETPHPLPPLPAALLAISAVIAAFRFLHKTSFSGRQLFAVVGGIASVMFLVSIFGPQNRLGAPFGVMMYLTLLVIVWRGMKRRSGGGESDARA